MRNPRTREVSDVLQSTQPAVLIHTWEEPLMTLLIGYTFRDSCCLVTQNRNNKSKNESSRHCAKLTFIHFWTGLRSMWKHMVHTGGVSNVFIMSTHLYGCACALPCIYFLWNEAPNVVAVCIAVKTRISRMCLIPVLAMTGLVILGFHFLLCKRAYQHPSLCCCKNKIW